MNINVFDIAFRTVLVAIILTDAINRKVRYDYR